MGVGRRKGESVSLVDVTIEGEGSVPLYLTVPSLGRDSVRPARPAVVMADPAKSTAVIEYLEERVKALQVENETLKHEQETLRVELERELVGDENEDERYQREYEETYGQLEEEPEEDVRMRKKDDPSQKKVKQTHEVIRRMADEGATTEEIFDAVYDFFFSRFD